MAYVPRNANGQATMANSSPMVIASDQSAVPVLDTNSAAMKTALEIIDNFISGSRGLVTEDNSAAIKTAVELIDDVVNVLGTATYTEGSSKGNLLAAVRRDANTTLVDTTNELAPLQVNATGELKIVHIQPLPAGTNVIGALSANQSVNMAQVVGTAVDVNSGNKSAGSQRVVIATDDVNLSAVKTSVELLDDTIIADDAAFTPAVTKVQMAGYTFDDVSPDSVNEGDAGAGRMSANRNQYVQIRDNAGNERGLNIDANGEIQISGSRNALTVSAHAVTNAGTFAVQDSEKLADDAAFGIGTTKVTPIGLLADETATDSVDEGDVGASRMTLNRQQIVTVRPNASGEGLDVYHLVSAATTNLQVVKASAGKVYGWFIYNSNAAARKLVFHNSASSPTAGAGVFFSIVIPPTSGANVEFTNGIPFSSGIAISTVTGLADTDTAAVALNDLIINIFYK